jgi:tetratricopeptide (TPR) repeat protein
MKGSRSAIRAGCLVAIIVGIAWNLRFAVADLLSRRNQPEATRLAMRLMPGDGAYAAQLADEIYASDPESAKPLLERAVKLNRYDAASWIQLGLLREAGNDLPGAEKALLQAAAADSTFLPSWSLANFYFRHENPARFWYWGRKAAQMAPDDATALFRLAWYVSPNAVEIEKQLQIKRSVIQSQLVNFLTAQGDANAVAEAASRLLAVNNKESTDTLLGACDWLMEHQHADLAEPLWNGVAERISYPPLGADSTDAVTNGSFGKPPLSHGFDWRLLTVEGVSSFLDVHPNALGFEFSGDEPDSFLLLDQTVPVKAQRDYRLTVDYETSGIEPGSGLAWRVTDPRTGGVLARTASLSAEREGQAYACFAAPERAAFVSLALSYQRRPGTVRVEGKLALKQVRLSITDRNCKEENPGSRT